MKINAGWLRPDKKGNYVTVEHRRTAVIMKVGKRVTGQINTRDLMAAPGGLKRERLH